MRARLRRPIGIVSIAVLLALAGPDPGVMARQETPATSQNEPPPGTGVITGLVIAADNALPVRRARVSVSGGSPPPARTGPAAAATLQFAGGSTQTRAEVFTDATGRFEIRGLPEGVYGVSVQPPPGFVSQRPVPPVRVESGKPVAVTLKLERAGAIEGRVLDGDGEPMAHAMVRAMSWANAGGTRRLAARAGASTDDLGQFRLFGLPAGEYFVSAQAQPMRLRNEAAAPAPGFVPTYFPGTADVAGATPIKVIAGEDVVGLDIPLQTATLVTVAGRVILPGGQAPPAGTRPAVTLVSVTDDQPVPRYGSQDSSSYRFMDVPPGEYLLAASVPPPAASWSSTDPNPTRPGVIVPVHVGSATVSIDLELNLGATVSGSVRIEGQAPAADMSAPGLRPVDTSAAVAVAPRLVSSSGGIMMAAAPGRPVQASDDGSFVLTGLRGQFLFNASGPGALKSVRLNGRDVTGTPIELAGTENLDGLEVTLARDVGVIRGRVLGQDGQPFGQALVMAIPTERERVFPLSPFVKSTGTVDMTLMPPRGIVPAGESNPTRTAEVRSTGDFTLPPLVAGRYRLVAYDRTTGPVGIPDIEEIRRIAATGTAVTVDPGQTLAVDLKLSQWPGSPAK